MMEPAAPKLDASLERRRDPRIPSPRSSHLLYLCDNMVTMHEPQFQKNLPSRNTHHLIQPCFSFVEFLFS
jgi:hypothetical protein